MKARFILSFIVLLCLFGIANAQDDIADVPNQSLNAQGDKNKHYFLIGAGENLKAPENGFGLVIVMPGGDGSADFNPFVRRIYKYALSEKFLVAQLVSVKWTPRQQIVWPTKKSKVTKQKFSTEDFIVDVINEIKSKYKINDKYIFTLSWSSSGPAAYAASIDPNCPVTGSYVAMSVFKPTSLGSLKAAKGHAYFIDHSPDDKVCPFWMAEKAQETLRENGAKTKLVTYEGGHGWHGNIYKRIREGFEWLQNPDDETVTERKQKKSEPPVTYNSSNKIPCKDSFETGDNTPDGWQKGAAVKGVRYVWYKRNATDGNASLCLKKTENRFFPIASWQKEFELEEGLKTLNVSAQVKASKAEKAVIDVIFLDENGGWIKHQWAVYIGAKEDGDPPANHNWKEYSGTVDVPAETKSIMIALQIYGPGTVWFDELALE